MAEEYRVIILSEAQRDIRETVLYIARELASPMAALRLEEALEAEIVSLSCMPKRVRTIDEQPWGKAGVRRTRVKNYYIYFLVDDGEKAVKVLAVIYSRRDQEGQLRTREIPE